MKTFIRKWLGVEELEDRLFELINKQIDPKQCHECGLYMAIAANKEKIIEEGGWYTEDRIVERYTCKHCKKSKK